MTAFSRLVLVVGFLLLLAVAGAGWYLFGSNGRPADELVPGDSVAFALISNGASIGAGYETSKLKQLADAPEAKPLFDSVTKLLGDKNLGLLRVLAPELSGQSFLAVTHVDPAHPGETGFIAGLRPKLGTDHFDEFVQQVNAAYPDLAKETKSGHDTLLGVDYQWLEGNNQPGRLCVAHYHGWIVTTWGEAALQDWLERMQGKSSTPSLADNADYTKSRDRVGDGQALVYVSYTHLFDLIGPQLASRNPALADNLKKQMTGIGGGAIGSSFKDGDIVDRFSLLDPKQSQLDHGSSAQPCPFDTLKFTGPDTRFYFGGSVNWPQAWKNFQTQLAGNEPAQNMVNQLTALAQAGNIDIEKNIFDALGSEYSVQLEWPADSLYPDLGVYVKVDKPDDFKPAVSALIDYTRSRFATSAVINEMEADNVHFATLKMVQPLPVSPTITEDGPYFGFFLNETHAVRALARDESRGLLHNDDFNRQIGSQRDGASQLVFLDAPKLLDQAYRTVLPYLSMAAMMNQQLAALVQGGNLPANLTWLAPMGTWSFVVRSDDDGITGTSVSGAGNQGILIAGGIAASAVVLEQSGLLPHTPDAPPAFPPSPASNSTVVAPVLPPLAPPVPSTPPAPPDALRLPLPAAPISLALGLAVLAAAWVPAAPVAASSPKPTFEEWSLFFLAGKPCGFGSTITTPLATPHGLEYRTELQQQFVVKRLGVSLKMTEVSHITERADGAVLAFDQLSSGMGSSIEMRGVRHGDDLIVTSRGQVQRYQVPALSALGPEAIRRQVDALPLKAGTPFTLNTFTTDYPRAVVVESGSIVDLEDHTVRGVTSKLWKISSETPVMPGILSVTWVDPANNDVETDVDIPGLGRMAQVVATRAECMKQPEGAEIFAGSLIAPQRALTDLPAQEQAVYRLTTSPGSPPLELWNEGEQHVLKSEPGLSEVEVTVPAWSAEDATYILPHASSAELRPYLRPSAYLESASPIIRRLALQAVGGETNPVRAAHRIETFVELYITKKDLNIGFASAEETAKSREGDCTEHAVLCAALGRAAGLPTRCVLGLGYIPPGETRPVISNAVDARTGLFGFHMWAEAMVGPDRWVAMDAALGGFDIGHIAILKSALADIDPMVDLNLPILQLMENLHITVLKTMRRPDSLAPSVPAPELRAPLLPTPAALPAVTTPPPPSPGVPAGSPSDID